MRTTPFTSREWTKIRQFCAGRKKPETYEESVKFNIDIAIRLCTRSQRPQKLSRALTEAIIRECWDDQD